MVSVGEAVMKYKWIAQCTLGGMVIAGLLTVGLPVLVWLIPVVFVCGIIVALLSLFKNFGPMVIIFMLVFGWGGIGLTQGMGWLTERFGFPDVIYAWGILAGLVLLKNSSGKKMTESETMIWAAMGELPSEIKSVSASDIVSEKKLAVLWLESTIEKRKDILKNVRNTINRTKFAILLGEKWFSDLNQREGATMNVAGFDFLFTMREIKIDL
jgi:hypothetical protein